MWWIVDPSNPEGTSSHVVAAGTPNREFDRLPGESDAAFDERIHREMGWEYPPKKRYGY